MNRNMNHCNFSVSGILYALMLASCVTALAGCKGVGKVSDTSIQVIDYPELQQLLNDRKKRTLLVDVRRPEAHAQGHIPGSINIPLIDLRESDPRLADAHNIVVYSGRFDDNLSLPAAKKLLILQYKNVFDFRGGYDLWKQMQEQRN